MSKTPTNESIIGFGEITKEVIKRPFADATKYRPGQRVDIAHYALSVDRALAYYRVANTLDWLSEDSIKLNAELDALVASKKTRPLTPVVNNNKASTTTIKKETTVVQTPKKQHLTLTTNKNQKKIKKQVVAFKRKNTKGEKTGMNKTELKTILNAFTPGQFVEFAFVGGKIDFEGNTFKSGAFTVLRVRNGRGKGGSRLVELRPGKVKLPAKEGHWSLTTGTPDSNKILNITVDGVKHGYDTEAEMPLVFERNAGQASQLKEGFKRLLDAEGQYTLSINSTQPVFNGKFTVTSAGLKKGRGGQVVLELQRVGKNEHVELWSYRHASVIEKVVLFNDDKSSEVLFG